MATPTPATSAASPFNTTLNFHPGNCTLSTCSIEYAYLLYDPNLFGNAFFLAIFALALPLQIMLGIWYRTSGVLVAMFCGTLLEILGYIGRIQMHFNPFAKQPFLMYLIPLTIGPVFLAAAVYLCLARIVVLYGENNSLMRARSYTWLFCGCDFVSLVIQATGGAKAALAEQKVEINKGTHIMVSGLSIQVFSLLLFITLTLIFLLKINSPTAILNPKRSALYNSVKFKIFLCSLALTTICIFIRSVFRVAELSGGFGGKLANNETSYMTLEGAMIVLSCACLTVMHPGIGFGREAWAEGDWSCKERKTRMKEKEEGCGVVDSDRSRKEDEIAGSN